MSSDVDRFYEKHAAGGPTHIVAALGMRKDGGVRFAVFSTLSLAKAWGATLVDDEVYGVVYSPYIVDVPEYGDLAKRDMQ